MDVPATDAVATLTMSFADTLTGVAELSLSGTSSLTGAKYLLTVSWTTAPILTLRRIDKACSKYHTFIYICHLYTSLRLP